MSHQISKTAAVIFTLLVSGAMLTNNYKFIYAPNESLIELTSSYQVSHFAAWQVDYLLSRGFSPGAKNEFGTSAYNMAFIDKNIALLEVMPKYMTKSEVKVHMVSIEEYPTSDADLKEVALESLKSQLHKN
ncbi:MAG: hypothetical protein V2I33_11260 [Kangiellaceae bacterium]|nr:hypothetical protein [Kangiellaceae bacterium]